MAVGVATGAASAQPEHARVRLICPEGSLIAGVQDVLALDFTIDDGWHLYWNGLNDTGFPPEIDWKLPEGLEITGPVLWPAPTRHVSPGDLVDHIYEKRVMLLVPVRASPDFSGKAHIEADLKWLVCQDVCLRGDAHVTLDVPVLPSPNDNVRLTRHDDYEVYKRTRGRVPIPAPTRAGVEVDLTGDSCSVRVPGAKTIVFYPLARCTPPADLVHEGSANGERLVITLQPKKGQETRVAGVLEVTVPGEPAPKFWTIDTAPPPAGDEGARRM